IQRTMRSLEVRNLALSPAHQVIIGTATSRPPPTGTTASSTRSRSTRVSLPQTKSRPISAPAGDTNPRVPAGYASLRLDAVAQHPDPGDLDLDEVAGLEEDRVGPERPNPGRRAGCDDVPWLQGDARADVSDQLGNRKDHVCGVAVLHQDSVDPRS